MHTDLDNIEKLLAKYLEAETSLQEEALLKDYFTGNNVASHLQDYQYMFHYFDNSKSERYTKSIRLNTNSTKRKWIGIAVSLTLLVGLFAYTNYQQRKIDKAYADTQMALQIIAKQMNKGTVAVAKLNRVEQTTLKVFK